MKKFIKLTFLCTHGDWKLYIDAANIRAIEENPGQGCVICVEIVPGVEKAYRVKESAEEIFSLSRPIV